MKRLTVVALVVALLAACGGEAAPAGGRPAVASTTSTAAAPAATAPTTAAPATTAPKAPPTRMIEDLSYHPGGEAFAAKAGKVDVVAPTIEGGPWPTVVAFHGDPRSVSKEWHRSDARLIAEQGRVVFLPAWGHLDRSAISEMGTQAAWDLSVRELKCAVAFARAHTADFGGDPDHITLYGLSAGGNAVLMAGLGDVEPLDTCAGDGSSVTVQALVPIDADWLLGGDWDSELTDNPEAFYSMTPWRLLDGAQDIPIHVVVAEIVGSYKRSVAPDSTWLSYRHPDIDLIADLTERGFLDDGELTLAETGEYAHQILAEGGYGGSFSVMPGAEHSHWGEAGTALVVETVLNAEG